MRLGVLLAAGESKRMGTSKIDLRWGAQSLLERSIETLLDAGVDHVRVVLPVVATLPEAFASASAPVEIVRNPSRAEGIASSIRAGLASLPPDTDNVVIALADMPLVTSDSIRALITACEAPGVRAAYPVHDGVRGNPVAWDRSVTPELKRLKGDRGARDLLARLGEAAVAVAVDDPGVRFDIDTPEDYRRARRALSKS